VFDPFPGKEERGERGGKSMMGRFSRYIEKVFDFGSMVKTLRDSRVKPQIPTAVIWTTVFGFLAGRRKSLNAMESELRFSKDLHGFIGSYQPSADRLGGVFGLLDPEPLRDILSAINHRLGRNKALKDRWPLRFVAVDGHECFSQSASPLFAV
jgi:hypothetical protein